MNAPMLAGFAMADSTFYEPDMSLFGWGGPGNLPSRGVRLPLSARVMVLEDGRSSRRVAYVVCDLGMISESLREAIAHRVCTPENRLEGHDLVVTATHTHSATNGLSTYLFYALSGPGVSPSVRETIATAVAGAVARAIAALQPARAWVGAGWIPLAEPIAFNRSPEAFNANPDCTPVDPDRADEAVDRTMTVLRVDSTSGVPLGLVSWFPVHGTSVHSDRGEVHGDNKGYAARDCEAWARQEGYGGFVAMFAQEAAGDVSPNYRWSARRGFLIGRYDDDDESARYNGLAQSRHARALWSHARTSGAEVSGPIESALRYHDFAALAAEADPSPDGSSMPAAPLLGLGASFGTREGPGPRYFRVLRAVAPLLRRLQDATTRRDRSEAWRRRHGAKVSLCDLGFGARNKTLGLVSASRLWVPSARTNSYFRRALSLPFGERTSWVPRWLPFQILRIGPLVIAALAQEATTAAGRRIRAALARSSTDPEARVIVSPYSNAYCGYVTTPEEYDVQSYEGASTLHGRSSLAGVLRAFEDLARDMRTGRARSSIARAPTPIPDHWCLSA